MMLLCKGLIYDLGQKRIVLRKTGCYVAIPETQLVIKPNKFSN